MTPLLLLLTTILFTTTEQQEIHQSSDVHSIYEVESITLTSTINTLTPLGPIWWCKEVEGIGEIFYTFRSTYFPREMPISDKTQQNNLDFSTHIIEVTQLNKVLLSQTEKRQFRGHHLNEGTGTELRIKGKWSSLLHHHHFLPTNYLPISHSFPKLSKN